MTFSTPLIWVMAAGNMIGALDRVLGNKLGLGQQFEEGVNAMGPLALGMVGIIVLASPFCQIVDISIKVPLRLADASRY